MRRLFAGWTGLEPATSAVTGQHSNQLNYQPKENLSCSEPNGSKITLYFKELLYLSVKEGAKVTHFCIPAKLFISKMVRDGFYAIYTALSHLMKQLNVITSCLLHF